MFERVKKGVKRLRSNVDVAKAKARGMSVAEMYDLEAKERREKAKYRKWEVEEKYKLKRKKYVKSGGKSQSGASKLLDSISGMGKNVLRNIEDTPTADFNAALTGVSTKRKKPKKKGKRKKKKVVIYV